MDRTTEVPKEDVIEEAVPDESKEPDDVIANWPQLQRLVEGTSVEELFEKGWTPSIKTKPNGKQYITLKINGKDPDTGKRIDTERGLGVLDDKTAIRWETLRGLFPEKVLLPTVIRRSTDSPIPPASSISNRSSITSTKIARVTPIGPSVNIELETLSWYMWAQQYRGYPEPLDTFINACVATLFREHFHKKLAVVDVRKKEDNC